MPNVQSRKATNFQGNWFAPMVRVAEVAKRVPHKEGHELTRTASGEGRAFSFENEG